MTTNTTESTAVTYEKGTWQADLDRSVKMADKGTEFKKKAGALLWKGATTAITHWIDEAENDKQAEGLAADLLAVMGNSRKGDVSKIKTVALAVRNKGLRLEDHPNLSKAYAAARALVVAETEHKTEDKVLADVVEALAAQVPADTGTTPEQAVAIIFAKGEDEAARLIGDALGSDDARRAWLRAVAADASGRVKAEAAKAKAAKDKERAEAKAQKDEERAKAAQAKAEAQAKAKATAKKATAKPATAKPAKATAKATPAKATPAKATAPKPTAKPVAKATPKA